MTSDETAVGAGGTLLVVLAAGAGSRYVGPTHKLLAPLRGSTVVGLSVAAAVEANVGDVVVIAGSIDLGDELPDATIEHNPDWRTGQRSSVLLAVDVARRRGAECVIIGLGDQPFVGADTWRALAASGAPIAVALHGGRRSNPVRIVRELWDEATRSMASPDEGLRSFLGLRPELVEEVPCEGSPDDIDFPEDLARWT